MAKTIGEIIIDVKADTSQLVSGMNRAERTVSKALGSMKKAVIGFAAAYASISTVRAFEGMVSGAADAADATGKLAQQLGLTANELSKYSYAAGFAAVSQDKLTAGLSSMIRRVNNFKRDGGGAAAKALKELGISADYAREHFTSTDAAFKDILRRLQEMPDGMKKTALAQDIFSKSASSMLRLTYSDLTKFGDEAERIGVAIPDSIAKMAASYHDEMDRLSARIDGIRNSVSYALIPVMNAAAEAAVQVFDEIVKGENDAKNGVAPLTNTFADLVDSVAVGVGFVSDWISGIELVAKSLQYSLYAIGLAMSKFFDNTIIDPINRAIEAYNALAEFVHTDKIDLKLTGYTPGILNEMDTLGSEISDLAHSLHDGRDAAESFSKHFRENLKKVIEDAKRTSSSVKQITADIKDVPEKLPLSIDAEMDLDWFAGLEDDLEDHKPKVEKEFHDWGDTLNSSISNAITDAIMSGDVAGAVQSLGASMGSSLIQSGTANLLQPLTQSLGMSGPWGSVASIGIGLGAAALPSLFGGGNEKSYSDKMLEKIDSELEKQTKRLDTQIALQSSLGLRGASAVSSYESLRAGYTAQQQKWVTQRIDVSPVRNRLNGLMYDTISSYDAFGSHSADDAKRALLDFESIFVDVGAAGLDASSSMKDFFDAVVEQNSALEVLNKELDNGLITQKDYNEWTKKIIDGNRDYAKSLIDLAAPLQNTADDLNDLYQQLTGEDLLGSAKLQRAHDDVAQLIGVADFTREQYTEYLKSLTLGLDSFGTSIDGMRESLLSTDAEVQDGAIKALEQLTGKYFESSEKALDYIDSIELVGQSYLDMGDAASSVAQAVDDATASMGYNIRRLYESVGREGVDMLNLIAAQNYIDTLKATGLYDSWSPSAEDIVRSALSGAFETKRALDFFTGIDPDVAEKALGYIYQIHEYAPQASSTGYDRPVRSQERMTFDYRTDEQRARDALAALQSYGRLVEYSDIGKITSDRIELLKTNLNGLATTDKEYYDTVTSSVSELERYIDSLGAAAESATTSLTDLSGIESFVSDIDAAASAARGFADSIFANNLSYTGELYRSYMSDAERLAAGIGTAAFTEADAAALRASVDAAAKYAGDYLSKRGVMQSYADYDYERASAANRMLAIEEKIGPRRDYVKETLEEIKAMRLDNAEQSERLLSVQQQLLDVEREISQIQRRSA